MEHEYTESLKKIYSIIEPIGNKSDKRKKKQFFNQAKKWSTRNKYSKTLLPVEKKTVIFTSDTKLNFKGEHQASFGSLIDSVRFHLSRGNMTAIMYALDPLSLISEKLKSTRSMVTSEVNTCLKEFLSYAFMCVLIAENVHEFKPSEHGEKLCDFLNEIGVME